MEIRPIIWSDYDKESIGELAGRHITIKDRGNGKHFDISIFGQMFYDLHTGTLHTAKIQAVNILKNFIHDISIP